MGTEEKRWCHGLTSFEKVHPFEQSSGYDRIFSNSGPHQETAEDKAMLSNIRAKQKQKRAT